MQLLTRDRLVKRLAINNAESATPMFSLPVWLSFVTLIIVLGVGFYQLKRVRQSQAKRGETPGGIAGPSQE